MEFTFWVLQAFIQNLAMFFTAFFKVFHYAISFRLAVDEYQGSHMSSAYEAASFM